MHPELTMMVLRRERDQRINALTREDEIRRAQGREARREGVSRSIAAGVRRALRLADAGWARLNRDRRRDDANPRPGGAEGSIAYSGEPATA